MGIAQVADFEQELGLKVLTTVYKYFQRTTKSCHNLFHKKFGDSSSFGVWAWISLSLFGQIASENYSHSVPNNGLG